MLWKLTLRCSLDCVYCFDNFYKKTGLVDKIQINKLITTLNQTKKKFKITFMGGGEPFMVPNLTEACVALVKHGHILGFNTNLIMPQMKRFAEKVDPQAVEYIVASLHIDELEKKNQLHTYIENYHLLQKKGFKLFASEVAYPPLAKKVEKYKAFFNDNNITFTYDPYIGTYKGKVYPESYSDDELKLFGLRREDIVVKEQLGQTCNAGFNTGFVNTNGDIFLCDMIPKKLGNIYSEINFNKHLIHCPLPRCECPLNLNDIPLFERAKQLESKVKEYPLMSLGLRIAYIPIVRSTLKRLFKF